MSERIALSRFQWQLAGFPIGEGQAAGAAETSSGEEWFDVPFPATVRQAHEHAGRELPKNWKNREWWYRCRFAKPGGKDRVVRLHVLGVDYRSFVYLNGDCLGENKGAFGPASFDVSGSLVEDNLLAICVNALPHPGDRMLSPSRHPLRWPVDGEISYADLGVWDDVWIDVSGPVYFDGWLIHGENTDGDGELSIRLDVNNTRSITTAQIRFRLEGEGIETVEEAHDIELATGLSQPEFTLMAPGAEAWFPHTAGRPKLYTFRAELALGGGKVDALEQRVAFRKTRVVRAGAEDKLWNVSVNGKHVELRGINWSAFPLPPGRDYQSLVKELAGLGVNAIRVWGGRHRNAFYDACNEQGILVMQEFPFGYLDGKTYPREAPDFPLAKEVPKIAKVDNNAFARHLRNHPSIFLWAGGTRIHSADNIKVMRTVEEALRREDGTRPYIPSVPAAGMHLDWDILQAALSPEHYEDAPRLLIASSVPAWAESSAPPHGVPGRWRKFGGTSAHARSIAWAIGGQRFGETAGGFVGEVCDWRPEGGQGLYDYAGEARPAKDVMAGLYAKSAAGLSFDWKRYEKSFEAEVWYVSDESTTDGEAAVWVTDADGEKVGESRVSGKLAKGKAVIGEVRFELKGKPPFTAYVQTEGQTAVPYPLDAAKPPSSYTLAELAQLRFKLSVQTLKPRYQRDIGIFALLPLEALVRGLFSLRMAIGL